MPFYSDATPRCHLTSLFSLFPISTQYHWQYQLLSNPSLHRLGRASVQLVLPGSIFPCFCGWCILRYAGASALPMVRASRTTHRKRGGGARTRYAA